MFWICFPGFNPLGQARAQFKIVWQRYNLNSSFTASRRSFVYSSRLSMIHLIKTIIALVTFNSNSNEGKMRIKKRCYARYCNIIYIRKTVKSILCCLFIFNKSHVKSILLKILVHNWSPIPYKMSWTTYYSRQPTSYEKLNFH